MTSIGGMVAIDLKERIERATRQGLQKGIGKTLENLAEQFRHTVRDAGRLQEVNTALAIHMRRGVIDAYTRNVLAVRSAPVYRVGENRFSGGALLEALSAPSMVEASPRGISFIDDELLDSQARHWYRLNFGALPASESIVAPKPIVRFGRGRAIRLTHLSAQQPSGPFRVPELPATRGHFKGDGSFYPFYNPGGVRVSGEFSKRGIGARRFLDEGLVAFAREFRPVYEAFFRESGVIATGSVRATKFISRA